MREPRPVWLTDQERRALRRMEDALACEDPTFAAFMGRSRVRWYRRLRHRPSRRFVLLAFVVLMVALVVLDAMLQTGGALLLMAFVPAVWWCARRTTVIEDSDGS